MQTSLIAPEEGLVLSNLEPGSTQTRLALGLVLTILVVSLLVMGPFVDIHPGAVGPFLPIYLSVMFVVDLITAVLLFSQFSILRSRALLVIANAYIFTALIVILSILSFPGVFLPGQGVVGKLQTTAWLYVVWHCGFAAFVFAYAWLQDLDVPNNNHRHMSPLWALYPGAEITPTQTNLFAAAKILLKWRGDGSTGGVARWLA